jgi:hypothetical protein
LASPDRDHPDLALGISRREGTNHVECGDDEARGYLESGADDFLLFIEDVD